MATSADTQNNVWAAIFRCFGSKLRHVIIDEIDRNRALAHMEGRKVSARFSTGDTFDFDQTLHNRLVQVYQASDLTTLAGIWAEAERCVP